MTTPSDPPFVRLDDLLKLAGVVGSGGQAKAMVQAGTVKVNGEVETRRGKKLRAGDKVSASGRTLDVAAILKEQETEPPAM